MKFRLNNFRAKNWKPINGKIYKVKYIREGFEYFHGTYKVKVIRPSPESFRKDCWKCEVIHAISGNGDLALLRYYHNNCLNVHKSWFIEAL